jgi:hypothetical protein
MADNSHECRGGRPKGDKPQRQQQHGPVKRSGENELTQQQHQDEPDRSGVGHGSKVEMTGGISAGTWSA